MGDTRSWPIFLVGLIVMAGVALLLLVGLVAAVVLLVKRLSARKQTKLDEEAKMAPPPGKPVSEGQAAYHVVSDTLVGLNARKSDNWFQAIFILASVLVAAAVGAMGAALNADWKLPWIGGALAGAFVGLLFGFFASGTVLMIYRAVRHLQGKHE